MAKYRLYNDDCLEVMKNIPDERIDLIITDPPYKITARGNGGNSGGMFQKKEVNNGKIFKHNDIEIEEWLPELYRILKPESHCYIMTNNKNITHYLSVIDKSDFHFIKCLIWVKDNKIMGQTYMSQFEYIIMLRKGKHKRINNCGTSDVLQVENEESNDVLRIKNKKMKNEEGKTIHDTEKPVELYEILLTNSSEENQIAFDPFMGLGGLGVACMKHNRKFIGIEIDKEYFDIAEERIELENEQCRK